MKKHIVIKEIELSELHNLYYERFSILHNFLVENGINYYAVGGTLLGAIRHNGIIPWDDDMDIGMIRDDYERFLQISSKLESEFLHISNYRNDNKTDHAITRVCLVGIRKKSCRFSTESSILFHIDIFPMDYVLKDEAKQNRVLKKVSKIKNYLYLKFRTFHSNSLLKKIGLALIKVCLFPLSSRFLCSKLDSLVSNKKDNEINTNLLWTSSGIYSYEKEIHSPDCFGVPKLHKFGPIEICIPEKYDEFLKTTYGVDYLTPMVREDSASSGILICEDFHERK